jgi:hypothetical protein
MSKAGTQSDPSTVAENQDQGFEYGECLSLTRPA